MKIDGMPAEKFFAKVILVAVIAIIVFPATEAFKDAVREYGPWGWQYLLFGSPDSVLKVFLVSKAVRLI